MLNLRPPSAHTTSFCLVQIFYQPEGIAATALLAKIEGETPANTSDLAQMSFDELSHYLEYDPMAYVPQKLEAGQNVFIKARCANCHDTEHSTATCPHFPASFTHDAALGYLPPPTTAGTSGSGKKGTKRQRPSRSNKSNKPAAAAGAAPPSGARPCRFGVNCRNKLTTCKFTH